MSSELKGKLAEIAAKMAASRTRLRGLERSAVALRGEIERLRAEARPGSGGDGQNEGEEFDLRVPTRPIASRRELQGAIGHADEGRLDATDEGHDVALVLDTPPVDVEGTGSFGGSAGSKPSDAQSAGAGSSTGSGGSGGSDGAQGGSEEPPRR